MMNGGTAMETETETPKRTPILELAWQHHADLDLAADKRTKGFYRHPQDGSPGLGILATLFAILTQQFFLDLENPPDTRSFPTMPALA